jgi:hypothetical protein
LTCPDCASWRRKFDALLLDFENAEMELRGKRREITRLKSELAQQNEQMVEAPVIQAVFDYWRLRCRKGRKSVKLGDKRRAAIKGRLRDGYTPKQIRIAIDGAVVGAFEKDGKRFDDLELICRDEVTLERFISRWAEHIERGHRRMADGGSFIDWDEEVDISPENVARVEEAFRIRRWLDEHGEERNAA